MPKLAKTKKMRYLVALEADNNADFVEGLQELLRRITRNGKPTHRATRGMMRTAKFGAVWKSKLLCTSLGVKN